MASSVRTGAMLLLLAVVLTGCGEPAVSGPAPIATLKSLRPVVASAEPGRWVEKLELSVTGRVFPMVGLGMKLTSVDPRVARLIRGAREVAVQVYERRSGPVVALTDGIPGAQRLLESVSAELSGMQWERVVAVLDGAQAVGVFLPAGWDGVGDVTCCLLVREAKDLVLVSARMDPRPLIELARESGVPGVPMIPVR